MGLSSGTLPASARSERVAARSAIAAIPGGVQGLLQFPIAAGVASSLPARTARGQSAQVDAGDARAGHRPGSLPELPALHHARDVGVGPGVAAFAGAAARARRDVGDRRHQLPQARHTLRRRGASVLRRARQGRQLPSGHHGAALGEGRAWMLGAALYLPKEWTRDRARCERVHVPADVRFQEKWRLALTLLRRARAAGLTFTAVLADAAYGDVTVFREALHRLDLPYAVGISSHLTVFPGTPRVVAPVATRGRGRPATRVRLIDAIAPIAVSRLAAGLPARASRVITWRNEHQATRWRAEFSRSA